MPQSITTDLSRIDLNESHVITIDRSNSNVIINWDGAGLDNYQEEHINEYLIVGLCTLTLQRVHLERFFTDTSLSIEIEKPDDFEEISMVMDNEFAILPDMQNLSISVYYPKEGFLSGIKWMLYFESAIFRWDDHITIPERDNGKILPDYWEVNRIERPRQEPPTGASM